MKNAMAKDEQMKLYLIFGGIGIALLALIIGWIVMRRRNRPVEETPILTVGDMIGHEEAAVSLDEDIEEDMLAEELIEVIEDQEPEPSPEEIERAKVFGEIENLAKQSPNDVAQLLKTWMADE